LPVHPGYTINLGLGLGLGSGIGSVTFNFLPVHPGDGVYLRVRVGFRYLFNIVDRVRVRVSNPPLFAYPSKIHYKPRIRVRLRLELRSELGFDLRIYA
jgi:hypothetical protein